MASDINRRFLMAAGAALLAWGTAGPAAAQAPTNLRFSAVFSEQDIRAEMMKRFGEEMKAQGFTLQPYYGGTLFKQGTELVAMQRGNLEMGNIAPQDISNQIPAWSIVTSAYLFRDADHLKKVFASDVGQQLKKMAVGPARHPHPRADLFRRAPCRPEAEEEDQHARRSWPASSCACPAATPGSSSASRSAPTRRRWPMRRSIPGLQSGAIDGQDNPLPNVQNMKFYEVMLADRADLASRRLRPSRRVEQGLERHVAGEAGGLPGGGRQGDRVEHAGAPEEGGGARRASSRSRASTSIRRT